MKIPTPLPSTAETKLYPHRRIKNFCTSMNQLLSKKKPLADSFSKTSIPQFPIQYKGFKKLDVIQSDYLNPIHLYELNNGHKILVIPQHDVPVIDFVTGVGTSLKNETDSHSGITHFVEHMIFKGSKKYPNAAKTKEIIAQSGSSYNAQTSYTSTQYPLTTHKNKFEKLFKYHADSLQQPLFPLKEVEKEKQVILEEIKYGKDDPKYNLIQPIKQILFKNTLEEKEILGTTKNLSQITRQDLIDYHRNFYIPRNMVTIISGDIEPQKAAQVVQKYFGNNKTHITGKLIENRAEVKMMPPLTSSDEIFYNPTLKDKGLFHYIVRGPQRGNVKEAVSLAFVIPCLHTRGVPRLSENLKNKKKLVDSIVTDLLLTKDHTSFCIEAGFRTNKLTPPYLQTLKTEIHQELQKLVDHPPSQEELEGYKKNIRRSLQVKHENLSISELMRNCLEEKDLKTTPYMMQLLDSITAEDIVQTVKKFLLAKPTTLTNVPAEFKNTLSFKGKLLEGCTTSLLENGTELITKNNPNSQFIDIAIAVQGGHFYVPGHEWSALKFLMSDGLTQKNPTEFKSFMEKNGISLTISPSNQSVIVSARAFSEDKEKLFSALDRFLNDFAVDPKEFEHLKAQRIARSQSTLKSNPLETIDTKVSDYFYRRIDPRSYAIEESIDQWKRLTLDQITELHKNMLPPVGMAVTVTGPHIHHEEMEEKLIPLLKRFQGGTKPFMPLSKVHVAQSEKLYIPLEGREQAHIRLIGNAPHPNSRDYRPFTFLQSIMSDGLSSRFIKRLREQEQGLIYGISFDYQPNKAGSLFEITTNTSNQPEKIHKVLQAVYGELKHAKNITRGEVEQFKQQMLLGSYLSQRNYSSQTQSLSMYRVLDSTLSKEEIIKKIQSVRPKDVRRVAKKYLTQPFLEVVGAPQSILDGLKHLSKRK